MVACTLVLAGLLSGQPSPRSGHQLLSAAQSYVLVERWDDAIAAAEEFERSYPGSPQVRHARFLRHKAQLFRVLARSAEDPSLQSLAPLVKELEALRNDKEPLDDAVAATKLALGTLHYLARSHRRPEAFVMEAVRDWHNIDRTRQTPHARPPDERDVVDIRNTLFEPYGGGVFAGDPRWSSVQWASRDAAYLLVNPVVYLRLGEHDRRLILANEPIPNHPSVVFMDGERRMFVDRIIRTLGTLRKRPWMKRGTPTDIFALWGKASFGYKGRFGGWLFAHPPRIVSVEFINPQRTVAIAAVVVGYSGGDVWMEKTSRGWKATGVRNFWVAAPR